MSQSTLSLFLDDIFLSHGIRPVELPDGSGHIDAGGPQLALRYIPLGDGTHLLLLNPHFFPETHPK